MVALSGLLAACGSSVAGAGGQASSGSSGSPTGSSTAGNRASAPGVTATTVTAGQVDDLSKPIPGLFKGAEVGTQAYFSYVNSQGGVYGRRLVLDVHDSQFDPTIYASATHAVAANDFAMVGAFGVFDVAEQPIIDQSGLPDISYTLSPKLYNDPHLYSPQGAAWDQVGLAPYKYYTQTYPQAVQKVGTLYASAVQGQFNTYLGAIHTAGWNLIYQRGIGTSETDFMADALKMKAAGVKLFYSIGNGAANTAAMLRDFGSINFHPVTFATAAYFNNMGQLAASYANGLMVVLPYVLYNGEDASSVPAVRLLDKWARQTDASYTTGSVDLVYGWAAGELFVDALKQAGRNPTRASLEAALDKQTSFTASGLFPPQNVVTGVSSNCWLAATFDNGRYRRASPSPKTGFICNAGAGYYHVPGQPSGPTR